MIKVIILEDEKTASDILCDHIKQYSLENKTEFDVKTFSHAEEFIKNIQVDTDILFMDIELPDINGMSVAKMIREKNKSVIIVFVTNLAQYAVEGYEVNAYDFILKPVRYTGFAMKLKRICTEIEHKQSDATISISSKGQIVKLYVNNIQYIEVQNHDAIIHTFKEDVVIRTPLQYFINLLEGQYFALCNSCYLVNLRHVKKIEQNTVYVGDDAVRISQPKRKSFLQEVGKYLGGSI